VAKAFVLLLVFAISASAGVRTVGNGGGFGEMKAHLALQQMSSQIHICLALSTVCKLTDEQKGRLIRLDKVLAIETSQGGLQFFNDPTLRRTVETQPRVGAPISLNSNLLTYRTGASETLGKISSYVLFGLLQHQAGSASSAELWGLAEIVFASFQENILTNAYNIGTNRILLHRLRFSELKTSRFIYESLLIEDQVKTYDLILTSGLDQMCPASSVAFSTKILSMSPGATGELNLQVGWSCDSKNWGKAAIYYHFNIDSRGQIVLPLQKSIRGVIKPAGIRLR
jgi:hypothetical protein